MARERAGAERRRHRPAAARAAARSCRCRGGRGRSRRARGSRAARAASSTSRGSSAGQSPGTSRTRSAPRTSAASIPRAAAADWPASSGSSTTIAPASSAARAASGSAVTTTTSSISWTAAQRVEHVGHHRGGELLALAGADRLAEALLGARERLDGQDGGGAHGRKPNRRGRREASTSAATRRRASCVAHLDVGDQRGHAVGALVGDEAVEQPGVVGGDARRSQRVAGPGHELVGRALEHRAARRAARRRRPARARAHGFAHARDGEDRADRDHRVRRPDDDRAAPRRSPRAPRASARGARCRGARRPRPGPPPRSRIMNSWNGVPAPARLTCVRTGSSHIGSTRAATPSAAPGLVDRLGQPARPRPAGGRGAAHSARSRSPRLNQTSSPSSRRPSMTWKVSPRQAPAALVDAVGEPEGDEVGVGGDVGAVDLDVVGRCWRSRRGRRRHVEQAARELGAAGAAGEQDDHGRSRQSPVIRIPACVL